MELQRISRTDDAALIYCNKLNFCLSHIYMYVKQFSYHLKIQLVVATILPICGVPRLAARSISDTNNTTSF